MLQVSSAPWNAELVGVGDEFLSMIWESREAKIEGEVERLSSGSLGKAQQEGGVIGRADHCGASERRTSKAEVPSLTY
jgi:hypothetical protein